MGTQLLWIKEARVAMGVGAISALPPFKNEK